MPKKGVFQARCKRGHLRDGRGSCKGCRPLYEKTYFSKKDNVEKRKKSKARWRRKHPHYDREYLRKKRAEALAIYGGKCACCEESRYEFLAFNHKLGGGTKHRKELKQDGSKFLTWLKRNNFPDTINILCHCCNVSLGMYGYCPHDKERTQSGTSNT